MLRKLNNWVRSGIISYFKVVTMGLLFSIVVAGCNKRIHPSGEINWLETWTPIKLKSDPSDREKFNAEIKHIRVYVRGWLADYADSVGKRWKVRHFFFDTASTAPLAFKFTAYLKPHVKKNPHHGTPGGHLIPPEPPQPE